MHTIHYRVVTILIGLLIFTSLACGSTQQINQLNPNEPEPVQEKQEEAEPTATIPEPTPTIHGEVNPTGILPAGMPAIMDGFVMVVDPSGMVIEGDYVAFSIQVDVIGEESHLFRYNPASIQLRDDIGNEYSQVINPEYGSRCTESDLFDPKQILVEPDETIVIEPPSDFSYFWWCLEDEDTYIPGYEAQISAGAAALILEFEGFGPFTGFAYSFDL